MNQFRLRHLQVVAPAADQGAYVTTVYKVTWTTPAYQFGFGLSLQPRERIFATKEVAQAWLESIREAANMIGFAECRPEIVEMELE